MNETIDTLIAKEAIRQQLVNYGRGMDRMDEGLVRHVFHSTATVDYGIPGVTTAQQLIDTCWVYHAKMDVMLHRIVNITVEVRADQSASEAYCIALLVERLDGAHVRETFAHARYLDRWSCQEGRWAIDARKALMDHGGTREYPVSFMPGNGRPDMDDPSYALFAKFERETGGH